MPAYDPAFPMGTSVRIASADRLGRFRATWKLHHPLSDEQLAFHDGVAAVSNVTYYHGGDTLYELQGIPGVWHEGCLGTVVTRAHVRRAAYWLGVAWMLCAMWWGLSSPPQERLSRHVVAMGFMISAFGAWRKRGDLEGGAAYRVNRVAAGAAQSILLAALGFGLALATILIVCLFAGVNYYASIQSQAP